MNSFLDLVNSRQSVRRYKSDRIESDKLGRCLEAARLAPSASNSQPWTFVVVDQPELREKVARETYNKVLTFNKFAIEAPVLIAIIIEKPKLVTQIGASIKNKEYPLIDVGIAAEHFCLQAAEEGLGTCMIGWFNEKSIKKMLNIPPRKTIGLLITVGYPVDGYRLRDKSRKNFEDVVRYNGYS